MPSKKKRSRKARGCKKKVDRRGEPPLEAPLTWQERTVMQKKHYCAGDGSRFMEL